MWPDDEITAAGLKEWFTGYIEGTLTPHVKSEPIPESNDEPVTVVVGKTFEDIVMDESKDVLIEFYAPWCGHCKSLAPKYDKLGEMFKANANVIIAKVDATANDTPVDIKGFPTIKFYPAGDKSNPLTYDGERSEDAMFEYIKKNGKATAVEPTEAAASGKDEL